MTSRLLLMIVLMAMAIAIVIVVIGLESSRFGGVITFPEQQVLQLTVSNG